MKKNIKEAIKEHLYANAFVTDPNNMGVVDRFFEHTKAAEWGADWRINSVWHDAANEKAENKPALIEYTHRDGSCGYLVVPNPQEVKEAIDRWAYIEDLLPNTEE